MLDSVNVLALAAHAMREVLYVPRTVEFVPGSVTGEFGPRTVQGPEADERPLVGGPCSPAATTTPGQVRSPNSPHRQTGGHVVGAGSAVGAAHSRGAARDGASARGAGKESAGWSSCSDAAVGKTTWRMSATGILLAAHVGNLFPCMPCVVAARTSFAVTPRRSHQRRLASSLPTVQICTLNCTLNEQRTQHNNSRTCVLFMFDRLVRLRAAS